MKKIYRRSQKQKILGRPVFGLDMHKYQLPYRGAGGCFCPEDIGHVELMLDAVGRHPELHVVSKLKNGWTVNRYEPEGAWAYHLYTGDSDPNIEFSPEWSDDDFTEDERQRSDKFIEEFRTTPWTAEEVAAVSWAINYMINRSPSDSGVSLKRKRGA